MTDSLVVVLDDAVVGTVTRLPRGRLRFDYDDGYRRRPDATPLSLSMPTVVASHGDHAITPWLWGLLPDNQAVLDRWSRQFHVSASSPFSLLSTPVGEDCAGAVRFAAPDQLDRILGRSGGVAWLTDDEVAERLRDLREDPTAWLGRSFTGQFSLAGAQGLCLAAARHAGLLAARTRVARFGDESAIVVDRYDRVTRDAAIRRIHQEDLCQALGVPPAGKYQNEGGPGPADIAGLLRGVMPPRVADVAIRRFADALIWNWLIGATDGHAKNYAVLLADKQVRLAPMYDVATALPYGTHERKLRLAMKVGGDYRVFPQRNTWPRAARDLGIHVDELVPRVRELGAAAPDAFLAAARDPDVRALDRPLPPKLVDLIADRAARCVAVLDVVDASS